MENNFKPIVGHKCQFWNQEIDLVVDCEVLVVDEPHTLSYTWLGWTDRYDCNMDLKRSG